MCNAALIGMGLMGGGSIMGGLGEEQGGRAMLGAVHDERQRQGAIQEHLNQENEATIAKMGAPALAGDAQAVAQPLAQANRQTQMVADSYGNAAADGQRPGVFASALRDSSNLAGDANSRALAGDLPVFALRRALSLQNRNLDQLQSERMGLAMRSRASLGLLPYELEAAGLQGGDLRASGQAMGLAGQGLVSSSIWKKSNSQPVSET